MQLIHVHRRHLLPYIEDWHHPPLLAEHGQAGQRAKNKFARRMGCQIVEEYIPKRQEDNGSPSGVLFVKRRVMLCQNIDKRMQTQKCILRFALQLMQLRTRTQTARDRQCDRRVLRRTVRPP